VRGAALSSLCRVSRRQHVLYAAEDFAGIDWDAIAWVVPREDLRGAAFEHEKNDIVHRHVHQMVEQGRGDHRTYTVKQRHKTRASLAAVLRRRL
jgi:hypothetical protein